MADIFVSYKKEDAGRVVRIVEGLRAEGFTVWWDHGIAPGSSWHQTIQRELEAAKVVVAVWSELSTSAPWVKEEAMAGQARGALVPVRIDDVAPPLGFGLVQYADLMEWSGDIEDKHWDFFIESIRATMDGKPVEGLEKPQAKKRRSIRFAAIAAIAVIVIFGVLISTFLQSERMTVVHGDTKFELEAVLRDDPFSSPPSDNEVSLFNKAQETRLKTDYQDYLRSFPQGAFAKQVREEILPLCEGEMRPVWNDNPAPIGQEFRVTSQTNPQSESMYHTSADAACSQAKTNFEDDADRYCRTIADATENRNRKVNFTHGECACFEDSNGHYCLLDSNYNCTYEMLTEEYVEVCG